MRWSWGCELHYGELLLAGLPGALCPESPGLCTLPSTFLVLLLASLTILIDLWEVILEDQELQAFLHLLEDSFFQEFLSKDPCFQISDMYLLATGLIYFQHASLMLCEYTHSSLFLSLFFANDMEEDLEKPKCHRQGANPLGLALGAVSPP